MATAGDTHLGGDDFDHRIVDHLAEDFKASNGIDLRDDPQALQRLFEAAEKAKVELSAVSQTMINHYLSLRLTHRGRSTSTSISCARTFVNSPQIWWSVVWARYGRRWRTPRSPLTTLIKSFS